MSTPLRFKELQLRNFLSFGNQLTTIDLTNVGTTLIVGENVDANSNNGAGKTTIINALCYAFYNKPFDNISLQRLINSTNNSKNTLMEVRLIFEKGDDEFEVYRCRGESFNIQIMMNGEDVTLDSVSENDKFVEEIVGMSYELFTKIIIFSGNSMPFLMMPVSQQRQQIEELFNITLLTEKSVKLKEIIKTTEGSIAIQEAIIKEQETQLALYNKQLKDAETRVERWQTQTTSEIKDIEETLLTLSTVDFDAEKLLHDERSKLKQEGAYLAAKLAPKKKDLQQLSKDLEKLMSEEEHLKDAKCPYCSQSYADSQSKLAVVLDSIEHKGTLLIELKSEVDDLDKQTAEKKTKLIEVEASIQHQDLDDLLKARENVAALKTKLEQLKTATNPHVEALEQLRQHAVVKVSYEQLDSLKKDLEHQQFLLKLLTDKNSFIRRRIINKTIPFLNNRLIYYTKELGLPHVVKFDDDMSCTVSEYGRELDFGNLSSGEKKRVNLSLSLAFRDVLHHLHSRVNCLFIDEIDASLDGSGVENVFKLLKVKTRDEGFGLWIISHRPEAVGRFDRTLVVRKENGFSRIAEEDELQLEVA